MIGSDGAGSRTRRRSAVLAAGGLLAAVLLSGCTATPVAHHPPTSTPDADAYGALPSFLPATTDRPNSMLVADVHHPAVTSEGDAVEVHLASGSVRMTVTGPEVPGEGLPVQPEDTTCTWTVTVSHASKPIRIRAADFNTLDHLGTVYTVAAVPGRPAIPAMLQPGRSVTFELRTAMPTGEGVMRWSAGTGKVLANWDFVVEND